MSNPKLSKQLFLCFFRPMDGTRNRTATCQLLPHQGGEGPRVRTKATGFSTVFSVTFFLVGWSLGCCTSVTGLQNCYEVILVSLWFLLWHFHRRKRVWSFLVHHLVEIIHCLLIFKIWHLVEIIESINFFYLWETKSN